MCDREKFTAVPPYRRERASIALASVMIDGDKPGSFEGLASSFDSTARGEKGPTRFASGAFDKALAKKTQYPLLWQHHDHEPIGVAQLRVEPGVGLMARCQLALGVKLADDAHELLKAGAINSLSIGFNPAVGSASLASVDGERVRVVGEADLLEISVVTFPADPKAKVRYVHRSADEAFAEEIAAYCTPRAVARREYEAMKSAQREGAARWGGPAFVP